MAKIYIIAKESGVITILQWYTEEGAIGLILRKDNNKIKGGLISFLCRKPVPWGGWGVWAAHNICVILFRGPMILTMSI